MSEDLRCAPHGVIFLLGLGLVQLLVTVRRMGSLRGRSQGLRLVVDMDMDMGMKMTMMREMR